MPGGSRTLTGHNAGFVGHTYGYTEDGTGMAQAQLLAQPEPRSSYCVGSVYCPNCSPAWLESFLGFAVKKGKAT